MLIKAPIILTLYQDNQQIKLFTVSGIFLHLKFEPKTNHLSRLNNKQTKKKNPVLLTLHNKG